MTPKDAPMVSLDNILSKLTIGAYNLPLFSTYKWAACIKDKFHVRILSLQ